MKEQSVKNVTRKDRGPGKGMDRRAEPVSFVLTVWLEPQATESEPEWRWRVRRVRGDRVAYFRRVANVLEFIAEESGLPGPQ
jgi:hypothetical protein